MAIRIVDGVGGAGKSYFLVNWLVTSGYYVELANGSWMLDPQNKVRILTNIDGLKLPHEDFQAAVDAAGGFANFFTIEYQQQFSGDFSLIYILDEAQRWFRPKHCKLTHENLLYFEWLRHHGHDLWLLTQDSRKIDLEVRCLVECIITGQPRTLNIANELTYHSNTYDGVFLETIRLIFSKKIASLNKSSSKDEKIKIKNPLARKFFLALAVALLMLTVSGYRLYSWWDHRRKMYSVANQPAAQSSPVSKASPSPVPSPSVSQAVSPASISSAVAGSLPQSSQSEPQVEYYMYRLDHAVSGITVKFLLGTVWVPMKEFPYRVIKKGSNYFAMIPAVLLPALENGARALPIRTDKNKG